MTPEPEFAYKTSDGRKVDGTIDSLRRLALALLFASFDMLQAAAACDMLDEETTDASRTRALETQSRSVTRGPSLRALSSGSLRKRLLRRRERASGSFTRSS